MQSSWQTVVFGDPDILYRPRSMRRQIVGTALLGTGVALLFATYGCWKFATRTEDVAQYNRKLDLIAHGVPTDQVDDVVEDVKANLVPTLVVGGAAITLLILGAVLRSPFREPQTEMTTRFFGAEAGTESTRGDSADHP